MPEILADADSVNHAAREIRNLLARNQEWFLAQNAGAPIALVTGEFEFTGARGERLIFSCWTEKGARSWRVRSWTWTGDKLVLEAARRLGAEQARLELIPRVSAKAVTASVAAARQARCERLAAVACEALPASRVEKVSLSPGMRRDQPGRYARIILRLPLERIAVTAIVAASDPRNVDSLFSSALLWFARVRDRSRRPYVEKLWLVVERNILTGTKQRHVLLNDDLRQRIELFVIDEAWENLTGKRPIERRELWRRRLVNLPNRPSAPETRRAREICMQSPNAIDVIRARQGETLRYHGLPVARVRCVMGSERVWFGIDGAQRILLGDRSREDWLKLWQDLETYRAAKVSDPRHWLYRAAGEAWLESILRRDISKLDPGLIIAPLHAQFRTARGTGIAARPIDLLALRHDGRLAVIELKVTEAREHVFQGVDYWRRVEAHRRRGHIAAARLFDDRPIADESPLVYLVAPMLRFHPSFATLARTIAPDIEIYRFDINEDWRTGVRVMRRTRVNGLTP